MPNTKDPEFEGQDQQPGGLGKRTESQEENKEADDTSTSGGRKGNFSEKDRDNESQWSPGSSGGPSDQ